MSGRRLSNEGCSFVTTSQLQCGHVRALDPPAQRAGRAQPRAEAAQTRSVVGTSGPKGRRDKARGFSPWLAPPHPRSPGGTQGASSSTKRSVVSLGAALESHRVDSMRCDVCGQHALHPAGELTPAPAPRAHRDDPFAHSPIPMFICSTVESGVCVSWRTSTV